MLERYLNGDETEKRQVVQALNDLPVPDLQTLPTEPTLEAEDGAHYCISATQNRTDGAIDQEGFSSLYRALVETGTEK